jgi:hypothetical protein
MKVLITGGRDFEDEDLLQQILGRLHSATPFSCLIHGAAKGADQLAGKWATENGVEAIACPADWKRHGRGAGPTRNKQMLEDHKPDLVVAFPGGKGTANMVALAQKAGTKIVFAQHG